MFQPADEDDLAAFLKKLPKGVPVLPVGLGSNLLIRDGGMKGVVIRLSAKGFGSIEEVGGNRLRAGGGRAGQASGGGCGQGRSRRFCVLHRYSWRSGRCAAHECGALTARKTRERMVELTAVDRDGNRHVLTNEDMGYAYRHSELRKT